MEEHPDNTKRGFTFTDQHGEEHCFDFASCTQINFRWAQAKYGVRTMCDSRNDRLRSDKLLLWRSVVLVSDTLLA